MKMTLRHNERIWISGAATLLALMLAPAGSALAEDFLEQVPARPGGTLRVDMDHGSVEVEAHDAPQVRVDARAQGDVDFDLRANGNDVEFTARSGGGFLSFFGGRRIHVRVRVPQEFSVDVRTNGGSIDIERLVGEVRAQTSGGSIGVEGASGEVRLKTSGGSIRVEDVDGSLDANTSGGNIDASNVDGRIQARTSGGSIDLRDVVGPVEARTSGGTVRTRFTRTPAGTLETSGGDVEVSFPATAGVELEARTSGGRIHLDPSLSKNRGPANRREVRESINGGGPRLSLRTSGGSIRVNGD
jgi:hypothetical protein